MFFRPRACEASLGENAHCQRGGERCKHAEKYLCQEPRVVIHDRTADHCSMEAESDNHEREDREENRHSDYVVEMPERCCEKVNVIRELFIGIHAFSPQVISPSDSRGCLVRAIKLALRQSPGDVVTERLQAR